MGNARLSEGIFHRHPGLGLAQQHRIRGAKGDNIAPRPNKNGQNLTIPSSLRTLLVDSYVERVISWDFEKEQAMYLPPPWLLTVMTMILASTGCCMTGTCGPQMGGPGALCGSSYAPCGSSPCGSASCGSESCGSESCGSGPCGCEARGGTCGCGAGGGCLSKIFSFAGSLAGGCCTGCGEVYYHDWISDPPCGDPCDDCGNWTGVPQTGGGLLSGCGGSCGGGCGSGCASSPGMLSRPILQPACGGPCLRTPGRMLYSSWAGLTGAGRHLIRGIAPMHGVCGGGCGIECGGASCSGCSTCGGSSFAGTTVFEAGVPTDAMIESVPHGPIHVPAADCPSCSANVHSNGPIGTGVARKLRSAPASTNMVIESPQTRPPHPVLARRLRK